MDEKSTANRRRTLGASVGVVKFHWGKHQSELRDDAREMTWRVAYLRSEDPPSRRMMKLSPPPWNLLVNEEGFPWS